MSEYVSKIAGVDIGLANSGITIVGVKKGYKGNLKDTKVILAEHFGTTKSNK